MSAESNLPDVVLTLTPVSDETPSIPQRRRSDRICAVCELSIGQSQFCVGLNSGRKLHIDCYLWMYRYAADSPVA